MFPSTLKFGDLDSVLLAKSDKTHKPINVCIFKFTQLANKDRVACQVFDGGTAYQPPQEGIATGMRLVLRASALPLQEVQVGLIIELATDTTIHRLKSGERVLDCHACKKIETWGDVNQRITCVVNNPLAMTDGDLEPVYKPEAENQYKPERRSSATTRAEPYAKRDSHQPVQSKHSSLPFLKISDLNQYVDRWRILARVTNKAPIKTYTNARGAGKLFNLDLIDSSSTEIRATFFNDAVDKFYELLQPDHVYSFANGSLKAANPKFKRFPHACEISFGEDADIQPQTDDGVPRQKFEPNPIASVETLDVGAYIDVAAVCYRIFDTTSITIRSTGAMKDKRNIILLDQSGVSVDVTIWGTSCSIFPNQEELEREKKDFYVTLKSVRVEEFNGKRLSCSADSRIDVYAFSRQNGQWSAAAPPAVQQLQRWYDQEGRNKQPRRLNASGATYNEPTTTIKAMVSLCKEKSADELTSGAYFSVIAGIQDFNVSASRKFFWTACPSCGKKVQGGPEVSGDPALSFAADPYHCANCDKEVPKPERKYNFNFDIQDYTSTLKVSVLGEVGESILGVSADEIEESKLNLDAEKEFSDYFTSLRRKEFIFRIGVKNDTWQDEARIKYRVMAAKALTGDCLVQQCHKYKEELLTLLPELRAANA